MTPEETRELLRDLAVAYPHLQDYINSLGDDWPATRGQWCQMLAATNHDYATIAIERIKAGDVPMPTSRWDLSTLPNLIRAQASRMADAAAKQRRLSQVKSETQRRQEPRTWINFGECYRVALAAGACKAAGIITVERNREIMDYVADMGLRREHEHLVIPDDVRAEYENPTNKVFAKP